MMSREQIQPRVLVVDDRDENLVAMRHSLSVLQASVVCVDNGNDALKQLLRNDFAVVLMDVQMPEMSGFETAELIRSNPDTMNVPIIFVTAINKEQQYVDQGYDLGAVDYLFKPVEPAMLRHKVGVFIELFRQRQQYASLAYRSQLILDSVKEGVLGIDTRGVVTFSNPSAAHMLGDTAAQILGFDVTRLMASCASGRSDSFKMACAAGNAFSRVDEEFVRADGSRFPVEYSAAPMVSRDQLRGHVLVFQDISARKQAEQQLAQLAEYDPLTGLANRRLFYRLLPKMLAKATRMHQKVGVLFVDVDHFKSINDTLGHSMGDLLLMQVARRLTESVRESDTVVRLAGDEFTVVVEGDITQPGLQQLGGNIISSMAKPFDLINTQVHCSVSIGAAIAPDVASDPNELMKAADVAMYNVKSSGRNGYQYYNETLSKLVTHRAMIETHLAAALEREEFNLAYQPKIELASGKLKGFESLLRWHSPTLSHVSPGEFIPIAEDCGRINDLGRWVLKEASRQLQLWSQRKLIESDFTLSVNFSMKQLNNPNLLREIESTISTSGIDPHNLDIELTESTLMMNPDAIIPLLRMLSQMGLTISVDDFGTGYSSLSYLKRLPIDNLKIDQSFVKDLFRDKNSEIITRSIISLAHNLGLRVIAEGVETTDQHEFLNDQGCDVGQGYFYGKPQLISETERRWFVG